MILNPLSLLIGLFFAPLAGIIAFLITYEEYSHHFSDKKKPKKLAFEAGMTAFIFFLLLSIFIGLIINNIS